MALLWFCLEKHVTWPVCTIKRSAPEGKACSCTLHSPQYLQVNLLLVLLLLLLLLTVSSPSVFKLELKQQKWDSHVAF